MVSFAEMLVEHLTTQLAQNIVQDRGNQGPDTKLAQKTRHLQIPREDLLIVSLKSYSNNLRQPPLLLHTTVLWFTRGFPGFFTGKTSADKLQVPLKNLGVWDHRFF